MHPVAAGVLGAVLGFVLMAVAWAVTTRTRHPGTEVTASSSEEDHPTVPEPVRDVLAVLRSGSVVVDDSGAVRLTSGPATTFGLSGGGEVIHHELRDVVTQVRNEGGVLDTELVLARGPVGPGRLVLGVRAGRISDHLTLVLVEDRTQARRVEEVRRDFVVNVSHELKTPVGGLALLAEAVEDAADDPEAVARFAGRMKMETQRLTRLVSEIVDLSRLQTADLLTDMVVVDVAAAAAEAVDHTRLVAGTREVVAATTGDPAQLRVHGDHELITTAIRNLVTNAISYSDDGTRVSVVTRRSGDLVEVAVTDQGRGISPVDQARVFERFYRVDAARSRSTGGTGLGLSIVKHICANHGGEVTVWSQEGQGSTFTIRLPAAPVPARPVGTPAPSGLGRPTMVADPAAHDAVA